LIIISRLISQLPLAFILIRDTPLAFAGRRFALRRRCPPGFHAFFGRRRRFIVAAIGSHATVDDE